MRAVLYAGLFMCLSFCLGHFAMAQQELQTSPYGNVPQQAMEVMQGGTENAPEEVPRSPFGGVPQVQQQKSLPETPGKKENLSPSESLWSIATNKPQQAAAPQKMAPIKQKLIPSTFGNVDKTGSMNPFGGVRQIAPPGPFGNVPARVKPASR